MNDFSEVEIFDPIHNVTFTFGEQVGEIDGEPIYATFADGKPWHAQFSRTLIEAMLIHGRKPPKAGTGRGLTSPRHRG